MKKLNIAMITAAIAMMAAGIIIPFTTHVDSLMEVLSVYGIFFGGAAMLYHH